MQSYRKVHLASLEGIWQGKKKDIFFPLHHLPNESYKHGHEVNKTTTIYMSNLQKKPKGTSSCIAHLLLSRHLFFLLFFFNVCLVCWHFSKLIPFFSEVISWLSSRVIQVQNFLCFSRVGIFVVDSFNSFNEVQKKCNNFIQFPCAWHNPKKVCNLLIVLVYLTQLLGTIFIPFHFSKNLLEVGYILWWNYCSNKFISWQCVKKFSTTFKVILSANT